MTYREFQSAIRAGHNPRPGLSPEQTAIWLDALGRSLDAMRCLENQNSPEASWIRAHLHREAGNSAAARRCYVLAHEEPRTRSLREERNDIALALYTRSEKKEPLHD